MYCLLQIRKMRAGLLLCACLAVLARADPSASAPAPSSHAVFSRGVTSEECPSGFAAVSTPSCTFSANPAYGYNSTRPSYDFVQNLLDSVNATCSGGVYTLHKNATDDPVLTNPVDLGVNPDEKFFTLDYRLETPHNLNITTVALKFMMVDCYSPVRFIPLIIADGIVTMEDVVVQWAWSGLEAKRPSGILLTPDYVSIPLVRTYAGFDFPGGFFELMRPGDNPPLVMNGWSASGDACEGDACRTWRTWYTTETGSDRRRGTTYTDYVVNIEFAYDDGRFISGVFGDGGGDGTGSGSSSGGPGGDGGSAGLDGGSGGNSRAARFESMWLTPFM